MTGKNISWKNSSTKSSTTESRSANDSSHSHKKSNTLHSRYVALPGDTPTKITLRRYSKASSSYSSSKDQINNSKCDAKQNEIAVEPLTTSASKVSTIARQPKEPSSNSVVDRTKLGGTTSIDEKFTKAKGVKRLDLLSNNSANNKKRAADCEEKQIAKKPRLTTDAQAVPTKPPNTTVLCITNNSQQVPATKRHSLATSIISFSHRSANALHQMQQFNNKFKQHVVSLPSAPFARSIATAVPPMPPNWINDYEETIMALDVTFQKYEIDRSTKEYQTIESMLYPLEANRVRRIVNPDLWKRFVNNRKEMLRSKSDDLNILSELGLDERDVMRCTYLVLNQGKGTLQSPYSDNMALLFHCTKSKTNLHSILSQGLDERLSNVFGGRLGKGIYFADDPQKAIQYDGTERILIFAVLLGDCISVDHFPFRNALVREPEKHSKEKRNLKDLFFDSIVGRPAGYNEYVIYNRHQCCPLYEVNFKRSQSETKPVNTDYAVKCLPPFAWLPDDTIYKQKVCESWPFMADQLFKKMEALSLQHDAYIYSDITSTTETNAEQQLSTDKKLATLVTFGFGDAVRNKEILSKFNYDLYSTLNYLLDESFQHFISISSSVATCPSMELFPSVAVTDCVANTDPKKSTQLPSEVADFLLEFDSRKAESINLTQAELVECTICYNEYESFTTSPELWKQVKCGHKMCLQCHSRMLTTRTTMSGVEQTFLKCPFCHDVTGVQIGTCPDIQMNVTIIPNSCDGYEQTTTISINYFVDAAYQMNRTAYLPNNDDGQEILKLLKRAHDRRLCFAVGESVTTGRENVLVWGVHHKTSRSGGILKYGYPDPGYLNRVRLELKSYGIQ